MLSGSSVFVKTPKDVIVDNSVFVELLLTILPAIESTCLYHCEIRTEGRANLGRYNNQSKACECFLASEEYFRDSRDVAPSVANGTFTVNRKILFKMLTAPKNVAKCGRQTCTTFKYRRSKTHLEFSAPSAYERFFCCQLKNPLKTGQSTRLGGFCL